MSNYTKTVDFASKDTLPSGDSGKIIKGTEFETEFDNIATAVATKADSAAPTFTGTSVFANLDISGDIDVDGTTNLDVVDIDGAVDMATTLAVAGNVDFNGDLDVDGTTNLDAVDIDGAVDFASTTAHAGNATFADNAKAIFGAGSDLQIYHTSTESWIQDAGSGNLYIDSNGAAIQLTSGGAAKSMINAVPNGGVTLFHNGSSILNTTTGGIDVTSNVTLNSATTAPVLKLSNNSDAIGAGDNLGLIEFYSGDDSGGGNAIKSTISTVQPAASPVSGEVVFKTSESTGSLTERLRVKATGIDVTGSVTAKGASGGNLFLTSTDLTAATGEDLGNINFVTEDASSGSSGTMAKISSVFESNGDNAAIKIQTGFSTGSGSPTLRDRALFASNGDVSLYEDTGTTPKLHWDASAESLGVGTTVPDSKIHLSDGALHIQQTGGSDTWFGLGTNNDNYITTGASGITVFRAVGTERMRIDSSGNVGIGMTANSGSLLNANGNIRAENSAFLAGREDAALPAFAFHDDTDTGMFNVASNILAFGTGGVERVRVDASGNLLVGTTSTPSATQAGFMFTGDQLYTSAGAATTTNYQVRFYNGNGLVGAITTDGSATAYLTSSDQRLKENIRDADDAGSKVDAIQVRKFDWKADGAHQDYGMIAQELIKVAPEAVSAPEDPYEMMGVDYSKLVPMLVKEIQQLRQRVAHLEE